MCSTQSAAGSQRRPKADLATHLGAAIDAVEAAVSAGDAGEEADVSGRLANAWATVAAADPELARLAERYGSP